MTQVPEQSLAELHRHVARLQSDLDRLRREEAAPRRRRWSPWLGATCVIAASWALSAQAPAGTDVEQRLSALERLVRRGPGGGTQVSVPFSVVGPSGKAILNVSTAYSPGAAVSVRAGPGIPGGVITLNSNSGTEVVSIGTRSDGGGGVGVTDGGALRTLLNQDGVTVYDAKRVHNAIVTAAGGVPRVAVRRGDMVGAEMSVDVDRGSAGYLQTMNSAGKGVAVVSATSAGGGALGVLNSASELRAEVSVAPDGRGEVRTYRSDGTKLTAYLGQMKGHPGGTLQLIGDKGLANLSIGQSGAAKLQLTDEAGVPVVEAGTLVSGQGAVRAGPGFRCEPIRSVGASLSIGRLPDCIVGVDQ